MKHHIVYLSGLPCTGKSAVLIEWAKRGGEIIPEFLTIPPPYVVDAWQSDEKTKLLAQQWIFNQYVEKEDRIREHTGNSPLLVERSPIDAVVYSRALGGLVARWTDNEVAMRTWTPGKIVFLNADVEILRNRMISGRDVSPTDWEQSLSFSQLLDHHYSYFVKLFGIPVINTANDIGIIMQEIKKLSQEGPTYVIEQLIYPHSSQERR